ncbi:type II secretion system protein [Oxalobacteraceae bacterium OM1]|nr:type II secretion system protein [Oxalobacteraceae bacterium OM1]
MTRFSAPARRGAPGFSLVELLVSVAILGLLASVALPLAELTVRRHKEVELRRALRDIRQGIDAYKQATAANRVATLPGQSGYPATLMDLVAGVADVANPSGPKLYFLRRLPSDPFYAGASTNPADSWGKRSFASPPDKPAEGADVFDVYSLSTDTGLNNVPYSEW